MPASWSSMNSRARRPDIAEAVYVEEDELFPAILVGDELWTVSLAQRDRI